MKKKVLCTALVAMMLMTTTASAEPWWLSKCRVTFDNELGIVGNVTLADILGHTTTEITERYYVKKDPSRLTGITDGFEI